MNKTARANEVKRILIKGQNARYHVSAFILSPQKSGNHQPTYMPRMLNSNVEIRIVGSSCRPQ